MKPIAFTEKEGGEWLPIEHYQEAYQRFGLQRPIFAIKFEDGSIVDLIAGWR